MSEFGKHITDRPLSVSGEAKSVIQACSICKDDDLLLNTNTSYGCLTKDHGGKNGIKWYFVGAVKIPKLMQDTFSPVYHIP